MQIGLIQQVWKVFLMELKTEWRQRYAINGILIQLVSAVFICFLAFPIMKAMTWNALFWLILLFVATSAMARSFVAESPGRMLYYHSLVSPVAIIYAKMIFNSVVAMVLASLSYFVFTILFNDPVLDKGAFWALILLFAAGLAATLTMVSAISSKTGNGYVLMPVLSFPVLIPLILITMNTSAKIVVTGGVAMKDVLLVAGLDVMVYVLASVLYQYLWQD